jgi:multidrug resistance efflux pump
LESFFRFPYNKKWQPPASRVSRPWNSPSVITAFSRSLRFLEVDNSRRSYFGLGLAVALLVLWMTWFFLAQVSVYEVSDKAELEVDQTAHPIESAVSGRVAASNLVLDKQVKAGDVLVELEAETQQFQLGEQQSQVSGSGSQISSIAAEIASEKQASEHEQAAAQQALEEARAHSREAESAAQFAQTETERLRKMFAVGVLPEVDLNRSVADAQQRRAAADSARHAAVRVEAEQHTRVNERSAQIQKLTSDLNRLKNERTTAGVTVQRLQQEVDRRRVRAPIDGKLGEVAPVRVGEMVHEGDRLGSVIPDGKLRVVANFEPPAALGRIHPGQNARLRLEGFPWGQYGSVTATVTNVASEIRDDRIRVELALNADGRSQIPLQHGLPGSVEVQVESISPASLVLRIAGSMLAGPKTNLTSRKTGATQ